MIKNIHSSGMSEMYLSTDFLPLAIIRSKTNKQNNWLAYTGHAL